MQRLQCEPKRSPSRRVFLLLLGTAEIVALPIPLSHWRSRTSVARAQLPPGTRSRVSVEIRDRYRYIETNAIPNHAVGQFPNPGNPNTIRAQRLTFRVPLHPRPAPQLLSATRPGPFGIAINGVPFEPGAAEFWRGNRDWQYAALSGGIDLGLDENNAHVQPSGLYHYHGVPTGLIASLGGDDRMHLLGYAADGFPIYNHRDRAGRVLRSSYRLKSGTRPGGANTPGGRYDGTFVQDYEYVSGAGDLDECNGREGATPEYPEGTYYYVATPEFPALSRLFRGQPDPSFARQPPEQQPGPPRRQRPRR